MPVDLEKTYTKLLRRALNVRANTPAITLFIESGCLPLKALVHARQLKFFTRYRDRAMSADTPRTRLFDRLVSEPMVYMQHYLDLCNKYNSLEEIYREASEELKEKVKTLADNGHYKYKIYSEYNPGLDTSPFLNNLHPLSGDIIRFRLGSHVLPIETGRWSRTPRANRLCTTCLTLGDEQHALFHCCLVDRGQLDLPDTLGGIWACEDVFALFERMKNAELLD